ncbi:putative polygalacturonase isoform X1 [Prunus yedoensis var. nudiflora]|uniref:Putative polygalacturonase isoform X1 n=1 Tax=Prunus yedoensis var. nudiflora TaxID=2094558 RepID=A0A314YMM7_PRUYE|nr:putative polygalacturonase isoform X1 [Prunus yedoensis var. nudiflora]
MGINLVFPGLHASLLLQLALFLFLAFSSAVQYDGEGKNGQCENKKSLDPRPHSVSLLEFGAVGDGKTLNTVAFQNAIFYVKSFADKGGAQLYVPPGSWLTGSFNLTSHLTLFLEAGAIILGSQDYAHWDIVKPLPSYGRGIDLPGWRYCSLINGHNLSDVVITGDNGTIDGQGSPTTSSGIHRIDNVTISNLTLLNSPAWNIHPAYCRYVQVLNITVHASPASPYTSGIVPVWVMMQLFLKSGWDEYGIAYGKPTKNVHIRSVNLQSSLGAGLAFGSEMSGGISTYL